MAVSLNGAAPMMASRDRFVEFLIFVQYSNAVRGEGNGKAYALPPIDKRAANKPCDSEAGESMSCRCVVVVKYKRRPEQVPPGNYHNDTTAQRIKISTRDPPSPSIGRIPQEG